VFPQPLEAMRDDEILRTGMDLAELRERFPLHRNDPDDPRARIHSCFFIEGDTLDFSVCTKAVGVEPTSTEERGIRGHFLPSGRPNILPASWRIGVVHEPSADLDGCLGSLLDLVHPRVEQIKRLLSDHHYAAGFLTSVTVFDEEPSYGLSSSTLQRLAAFELDWTLDIL
jgi:hypothetical protein